MCQVLCKHLTLIVCSGFQVRKNCISPLLQPNTLPQNLAAYKQHTITFLQFLCVRNLGMT